MTPQTCPHCHSKISDPKTSFCPICGLFRFGGLRNPQSFPSQFPETKLATNHYASLGTRFLARIIDYTILGILTCLIDWSSGGALIEGWIWFYNGISGIPQVIFAVCISMILFLGYFVVFQSFSGQTPGKWLCRIVVLKQGLRIPGFFSNVFREIGVWITVSTGGWLLLILIFSSRNKGFHDFLSGVEVYRSSES